ncbi:hypothetical protein JCM6882_004503 [Rhodosporidiobolus microsporus]
MSSSPSIYPPRAAPLRQQSRTPLLDAQARPTLSARGEAAGATFADEADEQEATPSSPLLSGRRGSGGSSGSSTPSSTSSSLDHAPSQAGDLTPLDLTLERIGVGRYQRTLLVLCGLGWAADNMWLQCVAVILPRVQESFGVEDRWVGVLSTSMFAGMMVGAWGWGSYSDAHGRLPAFNLTLCLTSIFGILSAFAPSFGWLCFALFLLGTGVGGSMPTDGTLFLENLPKTSHYLLTGLSVFFSLGAIFTSVLGLLILPRFSCSPARETAGTCTVAEHNQGWRYMLGALGAVSIIMFLSRVLFFRLQESAKFLVASNRPSAAVIALRRISKVNGQNVRWALEDVVDDTAAADVGAVAGEAGEGRKEERASVGAYEATGETLSPTRQPSSPSHPAADVSDLALDLESDPSLLSSSITTPSLRPAKDPPAWLARLPPSWQPSVEDYLARLEELLDPRDGGKRVTLLVWTVWGLASAGYTMFNVFLPKFLEAKLAASNPTGETSQEQTLWDYVLYTLSGLPGSLLGAYLVETSWGRAKTLAYSTLATSAGTFVFVFVTGSAGVVASSMGVSLAGTLMYAVIYGWTPECFPTSTRGTACGLASALSRLSGIVAPLVTGVLLSISISLPLFISGCCFFATAACAWGLRDVEGKMVREGGRGGRVAVH